MIAARLAAFLNAGDISGFALRLGLVLATVGLGTRLLVRTIQRHALAIPSIGRRLLVLLVIATVVPVVVMALLWASSSYLGTASERAEAARGQYLARAQALHDELALALAQPGLAEERLRALTAAEAGRRLGMTAWLGRGNWHRVAGDEAIDSAALATLPAVSPEVPVLIVGGRSYLCATLRAPADTTLAGLAVIPMRGALSEDIQRRIEAVLVFRKVAGQRVEILPTGVPAATPSRSGPEARTGFSLFDGFANLGSWARTPSGWERTNGLLTVHVDFWPTLAGFFRRALAWDVSLVTLGLIAILVFAGVRLWFRAVGLMRALGTSVTAAVAALRGGASALEAGRLEHRIPVEGDDELWGVAVAFNRMAEGLQRGRELERERGRIESELALARRIQSRLLPERPPGVAGVDIAGVSEPAREVGGDYFDHRVLADGRVALVIADVSGKGVPAALLMSAFRASLMSQLDGTGDPAHVMARVNRFLHQSVEPGRFVTAFLAVLDPRDGTLEYCNAGHNPPYVVGCDGAVTTLETGGLLLGMLEDGAYAKGTGVLAPGATLTLFTDGVTEAQAVDGAMWGEERLLELLRPRSGEPCEALARRIVDAVHGFEGDQGPSDDITLLLARRAPAG